MYIYIYIIERERDATRKLVPDALDRLSGGGTAWAWFDRDTIINNRRCECSFHM